MKQELETLLKNTRKNKRQIAELNALRQRQTQLKQPDPNIIKMIDDELKHLKGE